MTTTEKPKKIPFTDKPLAQRRISARKVLENTPEFVPIILESLKQLENEQAIRKYHVPRKMTITDFKTNLQHRLKMTESGKGNGLYIFIKNGRQTIKVTSTLAEIYEQCKSEDDWLYLVYDTQKSFGGGV